MSYEGSHQFAAGESVQLEETDWERWFAAAEKALALNLDGDEIADGYSVDGAYACWENGWSVAEYVERVREWIAETSPELALLDHDLRHARFYASGRPANAEAKRLAGGAE